jgi:hypothetical protein
MAFSDIYRKQGMLGRCLKFLLLHAALVENLEPVLSARNQH